MGGPKIREMRALSVIQPWATCIVEKGKNVENRSRTTHLRGTVAIHASKAIDAERFLQLKEDYGVTLNVESVPFGSIIGFADIVAVVTKKTLSRRTKKWFQGEFGYVLENVIVLKSPVPAKGALGFWRVSGKTLKRCLDQLPQSRIKRFAPLCRPK